MLRNYLDKLMYGKKAAAWSGGKEKEPSWGGAKLERMWMRENYFVSGYANEFF